MCVRSKCLSSLSFTLCLSSGVAVHVDPPYTDVGAFRRAWHSFPDDSTLHVFSIVFVCGCNLTLCLREVMFFCCSTESSSASTPRQDPSPIAIKALVVMVCFEVLCVKVMYTTVYFLISHVTGFGWGTA